MPIIMIVQPLPPNTVRLSDIMEIPEFPIIIPVLEYPDGMPECEQEELPY